MNSNIANIEKAIDYIENNLSNKLDLEQISEAVHYSKYHLHRLFSDTVGMTIHDYVGRRQLTEAAKLLVFSDRPIIEIAFICGYESQQAFSLAFKSMYKISPAQYRDNREFYPLQLRFTLYRNIVNKDFTKADICLAEKSDIPIWMDLMRLVIDGYPVMNEADYLNEITKAVEETNRRRKIQHEYNVKNGITPKTIIKDKQSTLLNVISLNKNVEDFVAEEMANAPYDERGLTIDGKSYKTDIGYAFDGINMFLDILERRENDKTRSCNYKR